MKKVSIIVPVYNSETYLRECVESVLANTYTALELILVDDGSTDASGEICDEFAQKDPRVKVLHQENSGVVCARNNGLAMATGAYIGFIDSDDTVSHLFYEQMVDAMERHEADIVTCEFRYKKEELDTVCTDRCHLFTSLEDQLAVILTAPWMRSVTWTSVSIWNKLYRADRIISHFQPDLPISEDCKFNWDFIRNSRRMVVLPVAMYYYRQHENSVMSQFRGNDVQVGKVLCVARIAQELAAEYPFKNTRMSRFLDARAAYNTHGTLWRIYISRAQDQYADFVKNGLALIRRNHRLCWDDKEAYSLPIRLMMGMCAHCFPLWRGAVGLFRLYQRFFL